MACYSLYSKMWHLASELSHHCSNNNPGIVSTAPGRATVLHSSMGASSMTLQWPSIATEFTVLLRVTSPADFSLRMNCFDSKVGLQGTSEGPHGSSEGPHGSSESLCYSEVTLYSPELAFREVRVSLYGLGWALTAPWRVSIWLQSKHLLLQGYSPWLQY